ncbi:MAG: DUF4333 domain-containing protein [Solirubrobacterales bacterium]
MGSGRGALLAIATLGVVATAASGCSSSLSSDELENQVSKSYKSQTGLTVKSISCEEAETSVGSPISCTATAPDGTKLTIDGKVTAFNEDSQVADFSWSAKPVGGSGG